LSIDVDVEKSAESIKNHRKPRGCESRVEINTFESIN